MQTTSSVSGSKSSSSGTLFEIPFLRPPFGNAEIGAVIDVMGTAAVSSGLAVLAFEERFREMTNSRYAYAVNSGTTALELALRALVRAGELSFGDRVIVPSFTFSAVANAVVSAGLEPCFADIDPETWNLDIDRIQATKEKAIIVTHTFGNPADISGAEGLATDHGLTLIEDCAEACGARCGDVPVGSFGDIATFSFNATKNMTTGEGGMVCTSSAPISTEISLLREHGLVYSARGVRDTLVPGHNYRLANILAAIGVKQFDKLESHNTFRNVIVESYRKALAGLPVTFQAVEPDSYHAYQVFTIRVPPQLRDLLYDRLREESIEAKIYFNLPIHLQTFYRERGFCCCTDNLLETESMALDCISLPMYPSLSINEVRRVAAVVAEVVG